MSVLYLDTETTGLDPLTCELVTLQIMNSKGESRIIKDPVTLKIIKPILERNLVEGHNLTFDSKVLKYHYDITLHNVYDTYLSEIALSGGRLAQRKGASLKDLVFKYCGVTLDESGQLCFKKGESLTAEQEKYAINNLKYLPEIMKQQQSKIKLLGLENTNPQVDSDENQENVISLLQAVNRPGIESLLDYLLESDYFVAPASTRFHNSFPGGLCLHSLNLVLAFSAANKQLLNPLPLDSVVICGLLHDLCKVNAYLEIGKGYKSIKGVTGHATLSLSRIGEHIQLTQQEDDVIRYHMGLFGIFTYHEHDTLSMHRAIMRTPHAQIFAALDMADSKRSTANGV